MKWTNTVDHYNLSNQCCTKFAFCTQEYTSLYISGDTMYENYFYKKLINFESCINQLDRLD